MQLTSSQRNSVEKLFSVFLRRNDFKSSSFKAPTGAGKTFMASEFISRVFANQMGNGDKKTIFVVATISNAELPKQLAKKLNLYKNYHDFSNYKIEFIKSPSSGKVNKIEGIPEFVLEDKKVFVFGTSSFGKNTLFYQNKTLDVFLQQAKVLNYQIFFIRDEAHIGKKEKIAKKELGSFDEKMKKASDFILEMTATPKSSRNLIEMTSKDMEKDGYYLLKTEPKKTSLLGDITNEQIIDDAIKEFAKSKKKYQRLENVIINPAMLIQVMNESDYERDPIKNKQFHEGLNLLEKKLQNAGLKYLKYFNNNQSNENKDKTNKSIVVGTNVPNTLDYASQSDSEIDAIIFKVGPATGWDIPRANMLLQLRSVCSDSLNIQTLGRIMRNPYPGLEKNETTNKYYVWSNYQKPTRDEVFYKIKNKFLNERFISGRINTDSRIVKSDEDLYKNKVVSFIKSKEFMNKIKDLKPRNIIYDTLSYGNAKVPNKIPNHVYLKIHNIHKQKEYEKTLKVSVFFDELSKIAKKINKNVEIIKYAFFTFIPKIKEIKSNNSEWVHNSEPYEFLDMQKVLTSYSIWKDNNKKPKKVDTSFFDNYGYVQISSKGDKNIQYLDSKPEEEFFKAFKSSISLKQRKNISFFSKMPTFGSNHYFEYYSKLQGKIVKSFMDFAIKYGSKTIMVEVKSKDNDYDVNKTNELLNAYKIYMENASKKNNQKNISLILFQYDKKNDSSTSHAYINNKWEEEVSLRDVLDSILK